jgi:hypothetical protein
MVNVVDLAEQTYRITRDDLRVSSNEINAAQTLRRSEDNQQLQTLLTRLAEAGLEAREPTASKVEAPINQSHPDQNPVVDWIRRPLERDGRQVGEVHHLIGPAGEYIYAIVLREGGGAEFTYIQAGEVAQTVVDERGTVLESTVDTQLDLSAFDDAQTRAISCREVCGQICAGGFAGTIPACIARCIATGPGAISCSALCSIIVGLGCLIGCDRICEAFEG